MTYNVVVTREDGNWLADVPSVPGSHTFARSLDGLMESIREVIVLMDDLDDDAVPMVHLDFQTEDTDVVEASHVAAERAQIAARETEMQRLTQRMVLKLTARGYSVRDVARILGVTPGRVSQLMKASTNGLTGAK